MNFYYNFEYLQDKTTFFAVHNRKLFLSPQPHPSLPPLSHTHHKIEDAST
jgi:hypothetical protein